MFLIVSVEPAVVFSIVTEIILIYWFAFISIAVERTKNPAK